MSTIPGLGESIKPFQHTLGNQQGVGMRTINRGCRIGELMAAGLLAVLAGGQGLRADVMSQMPADAALVVKINHIADTNKKVGILMEQLGITDMEPSLKDPLQTLLDSAKLGPGLDTKGDAGLYLMIDGLAAAGQGPGSHMEDHMVVLLPVADYDAFVTAENVARKEGDTTVVHPQNSEKDVFVQHWGTYAAMTGSKELLDVKHEGLKISGSSAGEAAADDGVIYFNFGPIKKVLMPLLDQGESALMEQVKADHSNEAAMKTKIAGAKQLVQVGREFLKDAEGATIGLTIEEKGIKTAFTMDFTPDSYLGKLAATMKTAEGSLLAGLPKERFIACGGFVQDPVWAGKLFDDLAGPITAELPGMGEDGKKIADILAMTRGVLLTAKGGGFELIAPEGAQKPTNLVEEVFIWKGDAAKMKASTGKMMELVGPMMNSLINMMATLNPGAPATGGDLFKTTSTPAYQTVEGVSLDRWQVQVNPDNTSQMAMDLTQSFNTLYGPDGISMVGGAMDESTFVGGMGVSEALLGKTIQAAKSGEDSLGLAMKEIDAQLPKSRALVEYLSVGEYMNFVFNMMKAQGLPVNIAVPAGLPPVGMTLGGSGASLRADGYIPVKLMQACVQTVMQVRMQMMGGKNQGGGL